MYSLTKILPWPTSFNQVKHKNNTERNFEKSKSAVEHQKLHGNLSEHVVTIQTVSAAFYV